MCSDQIIEEDGSASDFNISPKTADQMKEAVSLFKVPHVCLVRVHCRDTLADATDSSAVSLALPLNASKLYI